MLEILNTVEEYINFTSDGQLMNSGDVYYVREDNSAHFITNNVDGNTETFNANGDSESISSELSDLIEGDIETITIPVGTTSIGKNTFMELSSLKEVIIPNTVTSIGKQAFYLCTGLESITLPNSILTIDDYAFYQGTISELNIPDSVTTIGTNITANNSNLTTLRIGTGATTITAHAFPYCSNLSTVYIYAETPPVITQKYGSYDIFDDASSDLVIYVPADSVAAYKAARGWSEYIDKIQAIVE